MLQFITEYDPRVDVVEQVRAALNGGCRWIQTGADRTRLEQMIPLCKEQDAFLITEDNLELLEEFRIHGIYLRHATRDQIRELREKLGGHAVIGVEVSDAKEGVALKGLDVDYLAFRVDGVEDFEAFGIFAGEARTAGLPFHLVAIGNYPPAEAPRLIELGAGAVAMGWNSFSSQAALAVAPVKDIEAEASEEIEKVLHLIQG